MSRPRRLRWATLTKRIGSVRDALSNPSSTGVVTGKPTFLTLSTSLVVVKDALRNVIGEEDGTVGT